MSNVVYLFVKAYIVFVCLFLFALLNPVQYYQRGKRSGVCVCVCIEVFYALNDVQIFMVLSELIDILSVFFTNIFLIV